MGNAKNITKRNCQTIDLRIAENIKTLRGNDLILHMLS
jgi:hypothetical protein